MPGRREFAIIMGRALSDPRIHAAAALYVEHKLARSQTAVATVLGHLAMLGLHVSRVSDDGFVPGSPEILVTASIPGAHAAQAKRIADALAAPGVELLRPQPGGVYLAGFKEAYGPTISYRTAARERMEARRAAKGAGTPPATTPADPPQTPENTPPQTPSGTPEPTRNTEGTHAEPRGKTEGTSREDIENPSGFRAGSNPSAGSKPPTCSQNVPNSFAGRGVERGEEKRRGKDSPPSPPRRGGEVRPIPEPGPDTPPATPAPDPDDTFGRPLRPRDRERIARVLDYVVACGPLPDRAKATALRSRLRAGQLRDAEIRHALTATYAWVTAERLARHKLDAGWSRN